MLIFNHRETEKDGIIERLSIDVFLLLSVQGFIQFEEKFFE